MCMVTDNLVLVHYVLRRKFKMDQKQQMYEDLFQVGCIGLMKACDGFDESRGAFSTYAVFTIQGYILRELRERGSLLYVPRKEYVKTISVLRAVKEMGEYDIKEIANKTGLSELEVYQLRDVVEPLSSLDFVVSNHNGNDTDKSAIDLIPGDDDTEAEALAKFELERRLSKLTERQLAVVKCMFFENLSQPQTAQKLGISQPQVSRILKSIGSESPKRRKESLYDQVCVMLEQGYSSQVIKSKLELKEDTFRCYKSRYTREVLNGRREAI